MLRACTILLSMIFCTLVFSDVTYPEDFYVVHNTSKYRILLGQNETPDETILGDYISKEKLFEPVQDMWSIWKEVYSNITLIYETNPYEITYIILTSNEYTTSLGISVGSHEGLIFEKMGKPNYSYIDEGGNNLLYNFSIPEINEVGEYTQILFEVMDGIVTKIIISIVAGV
jgi:hypothetical protein